VPFRDGAFVRSIRFVMSFPYFFGVSFISASPAKM
jgi:hypothetical protein